MKAYDEKNINKLWTLISLATGKVTTKGSERKLYTSFWLTFYFLYPFKKMYYQYENNKK